MTYVINEELCAQKKMKSEELLLAIMIRNGVNLKATFDSMLNKQIIIENPNNKGNYMVTQRWSNVVDDILLSADNTIPTVKELEELATAMAHLFPTGVKPGTTTYWKGNRKDNVMKLQKFFKLYGQYTPEEVLQATKCYVNKYKNDYTTMRVLKYFILKNNESDLATILENINQPDSVQQEIDWETELR